MHEVRLWGAGVGRGDLNFDSIVFTSEALRHLVAECGASQIVMGTDYPYPWTSTAVEHILETPRLRDAERAAILGDNACKLLCMESQGML